MEVRTRSIKEKEAYVLPLSPGYPGGLWEGGGSALVRKAEREKDRERGRKDQLVGACLT